LSKNSVSNSAEAASTVGRLARAHDAVDVHERGVAAHVLVSRHGVPDVRAHVHVVDVEHGDRGEARVDQRLDAAADDLAIAVHLERELVAGFHVDGAGFLVDDVPSHVAALDGLERHQKLGDRALRPEAS
jgi:hypothetical protein